MRRRPSLSRPFVAYTFVSAIILFVLCDRLQTPLEATAENMHHLATVYNRLDKMQFQAARTCRHYHPDGHLGEMEANAEFGGIAYPCLSPNGTRYRTIVFDL